MVNPASNSGAVREVRLGGGGVLRVFGISFLLYAVFLALSNSVDSYDRIVYWAMWAGFGWHMTFLDHHVRVDLRRGTLVRQITSIYPVYRFSANLHAVSGFCVTKSLISRSSHYGTRRYELVVLFDTGERQHLMRLGGRAMLIAHGKQIAAMCGKPFLVDES